MSSTNFLHLFRDLVPASDQPQILSALLQDAVVWNALQDQALIEKICTQLQPQPQYQPEFWSPAAFALLSLDQPLSMLTTFRSSPITPVQSELSDRAIQAQDEIRNGEEYDITQAGLTALALRQRYFDTNSWQELAIQLSKDFLPVYNTGLSCLYGLLPDPIEMLRSMIFPGVSPKLIAAVIHALLSNPLPLETQTANLWEIINTRTIPLPAAEHAFLLHGIQTQSPQLAQSYSRQWAVVNPNQPYEYSWHTQNAIINLREIEGLILQAKIQQLIHSPIETASLICSAQEGLRSLQASLKSWEKQSLSQSDPSTSLFTTRPCDQEEENTKESLHTLQDEVTNTLTDAQAATQKGHSPQALLLTRNALDLITDQPANANRFLVEFPSPQIFMQMVDIFQKLNSLRDAERAINFSLTVYPDNPVLLTLSARLLHESGDSSNAIKPLTLATMLQPENLDLKKELIEILESVEDWPAALKERLLIQDAAQQTPTVDDLHGLAHCALEAGDIDLSLKTSQEILGQNPEDELAQYYLGEVLYRQDKLPEARDCFLKITQTMCHQPLPWLALARTYVQLGQIDFATETLQAGALTIPDDPAIHFALAKLFLIENSPSQALTHLEQASNLAPKDTQIAMLLGSVLQQLGHSSSARHVLENACHQTPNNPELAYSYAQILLSLGEFATALTPLEIAIQSNSLPTPDPYLDYAHVILKLYQQGELISADKALPAVQHALTQCPENPKALVLLAEALAANQQYTESMQTFQKVMETPFVQDPEWLARCDLGLGHAALAAGQLDIATAALQEAAQASPNNPLPHRFLSEAYLKDNLPDNALKSAHAALKLATDDPETLAWFADHIRNMYLSNDPARPHGLGVTSQLLDEAMNALTLAIGLAPDKPKLLVRLGELQMMRGDLVSALESFLQVANNAQSTSQDLHETGAYLLQLGESNAGLQCLEQAVALDKKQNGNASLDLLDELVKAYDKSGNPQLALNTLNSAIPSAPDKAPLYLWKARILIEMGKAEEALAALQMVVEQASINQSLIEGCYLIALVHRAKGNLSLALSYIRKGLDSTLQGIGSADPQLIRSTLKTLTLGMELNKAILNLEGASDLSKNLNLAVLTTQRDSTEFIDFLCQKVDLALAAGEEVELDPTLRATLEADTNHPRVQALKARMLASHGSYFTAIQVFDSALETYRNRYSAIKANGMPPQAQYLDCSAVFEAALELRFWNLALELAQRSIELAPDEALPYLSYARALVKRAEYQTLCESAQVITHAPGAEALSQLSHESFQQMTQKIEALLNNWLRSNPEWHFLVDNPLLKRWLARGEAVFGTGLPATQAIETLEQIVKDPSLQVFASTVNDAAALIMAYRRQQPQPQGIDTLGMALNAAKSYPQDPSVLTQVALSLAATHPEEALKAIRTVVTLTKDKNEPHSALLQALVAEMELDQGDISEACQAIETALQTLPDEPRWHALASRLALETENASVAIDHLEAAVKLEPKNISHHLALGRAYQLCSELDETYRQKSILAFERACHLAPKEPETWLSLAHANRYGGNMEEAVKCSDEALALEPDNSQALVLRAEIALDAHEYEKAYEYANKASHAQPDQADAQLILAKTLEALDRQSEAIQVLENAITSSANPLPLQIKHAELKQKVFGSADALSDLQSLADRYPDNASVLFALAKTYAECGDNDNAAQAAERALLDDNHTLDDQSLADLHLLLGRLLRQTGQLDQAIHHLSKAIHLSPQYIEPYLELGMARKERREYQQALQVFRQATVIASDDPRPFYQAGLALKEGKDYRQSELMLRRAANLSPNDVTIRRQLAAVVALNLVHNPKAGRMIGE